MNLEYERRLKLYREIYEKRRPESENLAERLKNHNAINLTRNLLFQIETYSGANIHLMPLHKVWLRKSLDDLKKIKNPNLLVKELKEENPLVFFELTGHYIWCLLYGNHKDQYKFLKF